MPSAASSASSIALMQPRPITAPASRAAPAARLSAGVESLRDLATVPPMRQIVRTAGDSPGAPSSGSARGPGAPAPLGATGVSLSKDAGSAAPSPLAALEDLGLTEQVPLMTYAQAEQQSGTWTYSVG